MKKIILFLFASFLINSAFAQFQFSEDFNYTSQGAGADTLTSPAIGGNIWKRHSGGSGVVRDIKFIATSLTYAGFSGSGIGGAAGFQNSVGSEDVNASIGVPDSTGSIYTAFMLKIDSSGGRDTATDYFFHYSDVAGPSITNFRSRLFVCDGSTSSKFRIGISKGTGAKLTATQITNGNKLPQFTTTEFNLGQTYFVVVKYTFNGTSLDRNDDMKLFVLSGSIPTSEPVADISYKDTTVSDLKRIASICIRQGSIGRTAGTIDGFRVFSTWDAATATALPVKLNSFNAVGFKSNVNINWSAICAENSCNFIVERSVDGNDFAEINTASTNPTGYYNLNDKNLPIVKTLFYRLKMVSNNGLTQYSSIRKVQLRDIKISVSPNPASNEILINASSAISSIELLDLSGKRFLSNQNINANSYRIAVSSLTEGTYFVKTIINNESTITKVIIKH